ncbi:lysophospholipid acyltransferase family protein [Candidatus Magnetominusculus xianensis]|uniref:Lipid A biosynthesis acyltransferase n=1 Tax=Candidatus Magnetominusculus xianensis TaxID=1748249 RepID=A0ABR5SGN3_9BACT|nr:lysophospholipid acyltransferase family protein [Candidatus Magnetominusculus xianensis]KWT84434.1 lipid A biosynthesis acyltransferase [Candidatus Magnetominusculus xianensis]MBF0404268.1 lysophospholipid acyltransferase family protein [Nitrospirota bacterium]
MSRLTGIVKNAAKFFYIYPFRIGVRLLPIGTSYTVGQFMGGVSFYLRGRKRKAIEQEARLLFPDSANKDIDSMVRLTFTNLFQKEIETFFYPTMNEQNIDGIIGIEGIEHLNAAIAAGKGTMLLFAHFGANQMVMPAIGYRGFKMSQLSAPATVWTEILGKEQNLIERRTMEIKWQCEESLPVRHINIFGSLKEAFLCLRRNEILGVAIDGGSGKERAAVDFLGKKALFSTGSAELALRTGCTVLPTFVLRDSKGYNTMIIEGPLSAPAKDRQGRQRAITAFIREFVERLEPYVLRHPSHYLDFLALRTYMAGLGDPDFFVEEQVAPVVNINHLLCERKVS